MAFSGQRLTIPGSPSELVQVQSPTNGEPTAIDTIINGGTVLSGTSSGVAVTNIGPGKVVGTAVTFAASPYSVQSADIRLDCATSGGAISVVLPTAASSQNRVVQVCDVSGSAATNNVTVTVSGGGTINGAASAVVNSAYGSLTATSNGSVWFITARIAAAASSPLTLVETKTLSGGTSTTFAGLNGDSDLVYFMEGEITSGSGTQIEIQVNAAGANYLMNYLSTSSGGGAPSSGTGTTIRFPGGSSIGSGDRTTWWCRIDAARGTTFGRQSLQLQINTYGSGAPNCVSQQMGAVYNGASANLTSLVVTNTAGAALTGQISLYKLSRT